MGHRLTVLDAEDCEFPPYLKAFFCRLKLKWIEYFTGKLREQQINDYELDNQHNMVTWKNFYTLFSEIRTLLDEEEYKTERLTWHPATANYAMIPEEATFIPQIKQTSIPDDFTEDEPSENNNFNEDLSTADDATPIESTKLPKKNRRSVNTSIFFSETDEQDDATTNEEENHSRGTSQSDADFSIRALEKGWNSSTTNPIFFGYNKITVNIIENTKKSEELKRQQREIDAVNRVKASRSTTLSELEAAIKGREQSRLKKIQEIVHKYESAKKKRQDDYNRNEKNLPPPAFKIYALTWEEENEAALEAYNYEIGGMKDKHDRITRADYTNLKKKIEDLEAFKEAEAQEFPSAERLEDIAKYELSFWTESLVARSNELDASRVEYQNLREELSTQQGKTSTRKEMQEIRSMLNVAETQVKEKQKAVEVALAWLDDCEILLERAARFKLLQDDFLPLFRLLTDYEKDTFCRLDVLVATLTLLCNGSFEKKFVYFFTLFNNPSRATVVNAHRFTQKFLIQATRVFNEALYKLKYLPFSPKIEEITATIERCYLDCSLAPNTPLLLFEVKLLLQRLFFWSQILSKAFGIPYSDKFSTYQRNRMSGFALLTRGLVGPTVCKYRVHYELNKYRPELSPENRAIMHERALAMGNADPLKPNYSQFLEKPKKKGYSNVAPLTHGHLVNIHYRRTLFLNECAIKVQRIYRGLRERRIAELAAKRVAFLEARELAMKEMKDKVKSEFKRREEGGGVGKMKWDAQVRIKQAKLRTQGQMLSRADTVLLMMDDAVERAKVEIESKFKQIEEQEGFGDDKILLQLNKYQQNSAILKQPGDVLGFKLFGLLFRVNTLDQTLTDIEALSAIASPRDDSKRALDENALLIEQESTALQVLSNQRSLQMIRGQYEWDPKGRGETLMQKELRLAMAFPEPETQHLCRRLMATDSVMTELKVVELLSELPTKQLLLLYIQRLTQPELITELKEHFRITRNFELIASILRSIFESDRVQGLEPKELVRLQYFSERIIHQTVHKETKKEVDSMNEIIHRRAQLMEEQNINDTIVTEEDLITVELDRMNSIFKRLFLSSKDIYQVYCKQRDRLKLLDLSLLELERKKHIFESLLKQHQGSKEVVPIITHEHRFNWLKRVSAALHASEDSEEDLLGKYTELRAIAVDFTTQATADAQIILSEFYLPKHQKTIPVTVEEEVDGRSGYTGRGQDGKCHYFEAHNIVFRVCLDYNGIFNGHDEYAMKSFGNDRLGSLQYFKRYLPRINIPLIANVDCFGFRVFAMSKLNCEKVSFTDEGEVRRVTEELVHGVQKKGDYFVNKSKGLETILRPAAEAMKLAEHFVKGLKDINALKTVSSSELLVFRGVNDEFYLRDFWRVFPPENPLETPHLLEAPREQSVFWRLLRPEFVQSYPKPLSPDACCNIIATVPDSESQYEDVRLATRSLIRDTIPLLIHDLTAMDFPLPLTHGLGIDLATEFHQRGINLRHMGLVRSLLWQDVDGTVSLYFQDRFITTQKDLRDEVSIGYKVRVAGVEYPVDVTERRQVTSKSIPIPEVYLGATLKNVTARVGAIPLDRNCNELRQLLLAEMTARSIKWIIRSALRNHVKHIQGISSEFVIRVVCEYMNVVTGSSASTSRILQDEVYEGVRQRFGRRSLVLRERDNFHIIIQPCIIYIIRRLQSMLGIQLTHSCIVEFHERPVAFTFVPIDVTTVLPITKHNLPFLSYADAMLAMKKAEDTEKKSYYQQVLLDDPAIFFTFSERIGSKIVENKGSLKKNGAGAMTNGCKLEAPGPIENDPFSRAVLFEPDKSPRIDTRYHPLVVPELAQVAFSIEAFLSVLGGQDTQRIVLVSGRYSLEIDRLNRVAFTLSLGIHDVHIAIQEVQPLIWYHVVTTYDGTSLRFYINSKLIIIVETDLLFTQKEEDYNKRNNSARAVIDQDENREREDGKEFCRKRAEEYFKSKEGLEEMREQAILILESKEFQAEEFDFPEDADDDMMLKIKKKEALIRAKKLYASELYARKIRDIAGRFRLQRQELEDRIRKERGEGMARMKRGLRIGSAFASGGSRDGKNFFNGKLSCLSIFPQCLLPDRVQIHFITSQSDATRNAQRLYSVATSKFEDALKIHSEDMTILRKYATILCSFLRTETNSPAVAIQSISQGKAKINEAIEKFKLMKLCDGIAEIMLAIPEEVEYSELLCLAFKAIISIDPMYFRKDTESGAATKPTVTRNQLINICRKFALDYPENNLTLLETAAALYVEVVSDLNLADVYGEVNLYWIYKLKSPELIIAIVKHAQEIGHLRAVKIGEMFRSSSRKKINIMDDDIRVLSEHLHQPALLDLADCPLLTDKATKYISAMNTLKILNLDRCPGLTDDSIDNLSELFVTLEVLSLQGNTGITDEGLMPIAMSCKKLQILNINNCSQITHEILIDLARNCRALTTLHAAATQITDHGLERMTHFLSSKHLTSIDISFCRDITDHGIIALAEKCTNLKYVNFCGLSRVTDDGIRILCRKCWYLKQVNFEDIFLLDDSAFWFDPILDGRMAADENMLRYLVSINLSDCVHLTDFGINGLTNRCHILEELRLRGCEKLTDRSLELLYEKPIPISSTVEYPTCDTLKLIDFSFCRNFTTKGICNLLKHCHIIEEISLSGIIGVNDSLVLEISKLCPAIIRLTLQRCLSVTDASLCAIADNLYLEYLDISYCNKVTDEGVEILTVACTGLHKIALRRITKLTSKSINAMTRNCKMLKELDIRECTNISEKSLKELNRHLIHVEVLI